MVNERKNIFTSKERYILKFILHDKIEQYKKHKNNVLISNYVKWEIDQTIKNIQKILKKIDNNNYVEKTKSYNELIKERYNG